MQGQRRSPYITKANNNSIAALGNEALKEIPLGTSLFFTFGAGAFSTRSLQGERNLSYLLADSFGVDAWGRLSIVL